MSVQAVAPQGLDAASYSQNCTPQEKWALDFFKDRYTVTGKEKRVLDVGCGDGNVTFKIATGFSPQTEFVGLDVSESMIKKAQADERTKKVGTFILGKAESLPRGNFDLIVSFCTMHFVMQQQLAIQEMYDSLAPNGKGMILVYAKSPKNMNPLAGSLMVSEKWAKHFPNGYKPSRVYFTPEEYKVMLEKAGFTSVAIETVMKEDLYPSMDKFVDWLCAVLNYVPQEIRREFARDLADKLDTSIDADGIVHHKMPLMQVVAEKPPIQAKL